MKQMTLIEMDGFLKGKCIPSDLKVNETNAEYLVRKFGELESKLETALRECRSAGITIDNLEAKCAAMAAENAGLKEYLAPVGLAIEGTPATDAFLAEVRASELDSLAGLAETMLVKFSNQQCSSDMHEVVGWKMVLQQANNRASRLRKGGSQ
ncbi:hypothetical protein LLF48_14110 [Escherichia coli]|nr:hypothetical protein [Escherichia coli]